MRRGPASTSDRGLRGPRLDNTLRGGVIGDETVRSVLNYGDLAQRDELLENGSHLNHAGAMTASARLADAIAGLDL